MDQTPIETRPSPATASDNVQPLVLDPGQGQPVSPEDEAKAKAEAARLIDINEVARCWHGLVTLRQSFSAMTQLLWETIQQNEGSHDALELFVQAAISEANKGFQLHASAGQVSLPRKLASQVLPVLENYAGLMLARQRIELQRLNQCEQDRRKGIPVKLGFCLQEGQPATVGTDRSLILVGPEEAVRYLCRSTVGHLLDEPGKEEEAQPKWRILHFAGKGQEAQDVRHLVLHFEDLIRLSARRRPDWMIGRMQSQWYGHPPDLIIVQDLARFGSGLITSTPTELSGFQAAEIHRKLRLFANAFNSRVLIGVTRRLDRAPDVALDGWPTLQAYADVVSIGVNRTETTLDISDSGGTYKVLSVPLEDLAPPVSKLILTNRPRVRPLVVPGMPKA